MSSSGMPACGHAGTVAGVDECVGAGSENAPPARGKQRGLGVENHGFAGFHFQRGHAHHSAFSIANDVQCHPFNEELRVGIHVALVQRVQMA